MLEWLLIFWIKIDDQVAYHEIAIPGRSYCPAHYVDASEDVCADAVEVVARELKRKAPLRRLPRADYLVSGCFPVEVPVLMVSQ